MRTRKFKRIGTYVVHYAWLDDGIIHRSHTCADGFDQVDAREKFQRRNQHVLVYVPNQYNFEDPSMKILLATRRESAGLVLAEGTV